DGGIEGTGGGRVRGHQFAPDELAVGRALGIRGCLQHGFLLLWCGLHCDTSGWGRPVLPKPGSSTVIPVTGTGMAECKWRFHSKSSYLRGSPSPRLRFALPVNGARGNGGGAASVLLTASGKKVPGRADE